MPRRFSFNKIFLQIGFAAWLALVFPSVGRLYGHDTSKADDGFQVQPTDWPWWRGHFRNGTASADQTPPTEWSETKNVLWKKPIPGRGYGSFSLVGERLFVQSADEQTGGQFVLCFRRSTGEELWKTIVHASGGMRKNAKSTSASSTPACDGERIYVNFPNQDTLQTTCLDLNGKQLWQAKISDYVEHQGYGSSPALYQSLVIVSSDNKSGGAIVALDRKSGQVVWSRERPKQPNYPSPVVFKVNNRDQMIMTGCDKVTSLNPLTGSTLWEIDGATTECVTSTVTDGQRVFTSGGYPRNHMSAIAADGSGKVVWENSTRLYVPSLLVREGFLYGVLDAGIAVCWKSDTGEEVWRQRLGGTFSASPVLVGETIYATNEGGETFVFRAEPSGYKQLATNKLGEEVLSTPVICDSRIYYRASNVVDGKRTEYLYCLGK
ncbi:MAG: PQQ-binding-like beta-propeller repeat protein [Pirellula sp.]